jgi:hypothetical protein
VPTPSGYYLLNHYFSIELIGQRCEYSSLGHVNIFLLPLDLWHVQAESDIILSTQRQETTIEYMRELIMVVVVVVAANSRVNQ